MSDLIDRIQAARTRSIEWIATSRARLGGAPVFRESAACDLEAWPGMALPGTYNIAMLARLIGAPLPDAPAMANWIAAQRQPDGTWWLHGMAPEDTFKKDDPVETRFYLQGHITNYTLGGLQALGRAVTPPDTARPYADVAVLQNWMAGRDWDDPWQEGNNIVNLGSFLRLAGADAALNWLLDWHVDHVNPDTGFWGNGQDTDLGRLHAMAGACHNYHLFFAADRPVPHLDKAVDYCLSQPPHVVSACIDADLVDILANAHVLINHRRDEIAGWLTTLAHALLDFQNADGGFADETTGTRRFDGWVNGYTEPQGISCGFATFFRWIALAMIARVLNPADHSWNFRPMVGLGYFRHG
ncbi:hypothetical protein ACMU_19010 [Actibacterium mucosum KCTC 23349]|uniref:Squalene cyclase C-terminal domain-containing protein n=1 Tax=Actibacterium mucosum KCTC 23349 TaxID=1454373 RepID=A0A037ZCT9_9RHOB|nr:hypothetical protein [Actibacterium mucosum]KAJ54314.1 hypothetical protein ACMU_19010 [Actibacterium mucosum KCTC 23349]